MEKSDNFDAVDGGKKGDNGGKITMDAGAGAGDGTWNDKNYIWAFCISVFLITVISIIVFASGSGSTAETDNTLNGTASSVSTTSTTSETTTADDGGRYPYTGQLLGSLFMPVFLAALVGYGWTYVLARETKTVVTCCLLMPPLLWTILCVLIIVVAPDATLGVIVMLGIYLLIYGMIYWFVIRPGRQFAEIMLASAGTVVRMYPKLFVYSFMSMFFFFMHFVVVIVNIVFFALGGGFNGAPFLVCVYCLFLLLIWWWGSGTVKNIVFTTIAGTVASWYFSPGGFSSTDKISGADSAAFKRARTTSLGSNFMAALLLAAIKVVSFVIQNIVRNYCGPCCSCCITWLMNTIEALVERYSQYALVQVALYGVGFQEACTNTNEMFRQGENMILKFVATECVAGIILSYGGLACACLVAIGNCLFTMAIWPNSTEWTGNLWAVIVFTLWALIVGMLVVALINGVIDSSIVSMFVCYGMEPDVLKETKPEVDAAMQEAIARMKAKPSKQYQRHMDKEKGIKH